jgi:hypothetical protein
MPVINKGVGISAIAVGWIATPFAATRILLLCSQLFGAV